MRRTAEVLFERLQEALGIRIEPVDVVCDGHRITRLWRVVRPGRVMAQLLEQPMKRAPEERRGPLEIHYGGRTLWRIEVDEAGENRLVSSGWIPEW